ncbi:MAG: hypothetical protein QG654_122 [Patescibacteria group bacterium]|nr:hypothetical protein [Patescibacteria group bacterium]
MKNLFFPAFALVLLSCNTSPGITLDDLERRDSVMLVKFDSVIDQKMYEAGFSVFDVDSTSFVLNRAEASAVFERTMDLYKKLAGLDVSSTSNGLEFPKGALDHQFFSASNGERYSMMLTVDEDRGHVWAHFDQSRPGDKCIVFEMDLMLMVDASSGKAQAYYGYGDVRAFNTCSKTSDDQLASEYLEDVTRQAIVAPNWVLSEFEMMLESETSLGS